jgi:hypothetical protein
MRRAAGSLRAIGEATGAAGARGDEHGQGDRDNSQKMLRL